MHIVFLYYLYGILIGIGISFQNKKVEIKSQAKLCSAINFSDTKIQNLPAVQIRDGMGNSKFLIKTNNPKNQELFNYGLNLIHGFWHIEALRVFKEILKSEPKNAMAWWGVAMCQPGFGGDDNSQWQTAIFNASKFAISPIEKDIIEATQVLVNKGIHKAIDSFILLKNKYPNNPEILSFYFIVKRQNIKSDFESDLIKNELEQALEVFPQHIGLWHYYMHILENRKDFELIEKNLIHIQKLAPNAPHMIHMPGHYYFKKGLYHKAIEVFEKSLLTERKFHIEDNIPLGLNQNYLHNLHFLALCYSEIGEFIKSYEYALEYANLSYGTSQPTDGNTLMLLYEGRIMPALVNIRFRNYQKAIKDLDFWLHIYDFPINNQLVTIYLNTIKDYCKGMIAINLQNENEAINYSNRMKENITQYQKLANVRHYSVEFKPINETYDIMQMAWYELVGWGVNINSSRPFIEEPWLKAIELENAIGYDEPPRLMYPICESKALLHKKRGELKLLNFEINKAFSKRPNSKIIGNIALNI